MNPSAVSLRLVFSLWWVGVSVGFIVLVFCVHFWDDCMGQLNCSRWQSVEINEQARKLFEDVGSGFVVLHYV